MPVGFAPRSGPSGGGRAGFDGAGVAVAPSGGPDLSGMSSEPVTPESQGAGDMSDQQLREVTSGS